MDSHMTTHSIDSSVSTNGAGEEEVISSGSSFQEMMAPNTESPAETASSNGVPGGPSGGVSNDSSVLASSSADSVATVTVGLSSLSTATSAMTNTKMETLADVPADPTPESSRAPATSAVVTTAGLLPVSHAVIAAASAAMSAQLASSTDGQDGGSGEDAAEENGAEGKCGGASGQQGPKKMPMALVNELAKFNKVKAVYVLEDEAGPAHKKTFYIRLEVGEENFHAHGPSIRKAQHAAAEVALQRSNLPRPPPRPAHSYNARGGWGGNLGRGGSRLGSGDQRSGGPSASGNNYQPVVELNTLAQRRGEDVIYTAMDPPPPHHPATHGYPPALTGSGPPPAAGFRGHGARGPPMTAWGCGPPISGPMGAVAGSGGGGGGGGMYPGFSLPGAQPVPSHAAMHLYQHAGRFPAWPGPGNVYPRRFTVLLKVGPREFQGEGVTRQAARNNAANKALRLLRYMPMPSSTLEQQREGGDHPYEHQSPVECRQKRNGKTGGGDDASAEQEDKADSEGDSSDDEAPLLSASNGARKKSDISIVHEVGLKLRQHATFEMVKEAGPAHSKIFTYRCKLGTREAEGDGNSKKRAKLFAAKAMLEKLRQEFTETGRDYIIKMCSEVAAQRIDATGEPMKKTNQTRKKNRNLIKEQKTDPEYGQQVNPVSRLIQVQQGRKEADPIFEMVTERGLNKKKEFVYRCSVGDHTTEGVGQNKRLAKRQAAEHMLDSLGYKRIEKFPIKSVLKNGHSGVPVLSGAVDVPVEVAASPVLSGGAVAGPAVSNPSSGPDLAGLGGAVGPSQSQAPPPPPSSRHPQPPMQRSERMSGPGMGGGMKGRPSGFLCNVSNGKRLGGSHLDGGGPSLGGMSFGAHNSPIGANKKNVSFSMARGVLYVPDANFSAQQRVNHQQGSPHHPMPPQQHPGHPHPHQQQQHHQLSPQGHHHNSAFSQQTNNNRMTSSPTQPDSRLHMFQQQQQQHNSLRYQAAMAAAVAEPRQQQQQQPQHQAAGQAPSSHLQQAMNIGNFPSSGWLPAGATSMAGGSSGGQGLGSMASAFSSASSMPGSSGLGAGPPLDLMRGGGSGGYHGGTPTASQQLSPGGYPSVSSSTQAHQLSSSSQAVFGPHHSFTGSISGPRASSAGHSSDFMHRGGPGHSAVAGSPGGAAQPGLDHFSRANMMMSSPPQPRIHLDYTTASLFPDAIRAEVQLNYVCESMGYKCQFSDQPKGSQQGISKSDYFSSLTVSLGPGQQIVFSGSGASVQEAHDAAAVACLQDLYNQSKTPYSDMAMHMNAMAPSHAEMLGGPPV